MKLNSMEELHKCQYDRCEITFKPFGLAVDTCEEDKDGILWVYNDEYKNRVNYCPFCGYEAPNKDTFDWSCEED